MLYTHYFTGKHQFPNSFLSLTHDKQDAIIREIDSLIESAYQNKKEFVVRELVGSTAPSYENGWEGHPIYELFLFNKNKYNDVQSAILQAGKDIGFLFKERLEESKHCFELHHGYFNSYKPL